MSILPADGASNRPVCLGGERRCLPEDVGGVHGYQEFLEATKGRTFESVSTMVTACWNFTSGRITGESGRRRSRFRVEDDRRFRREADQSFADPEIVIGLIQE